MSECLGGERDGDRLCKGIKNAMTRCPLLGGRLAEGRDPQAPATHWVNNLHRGRLGRETLQKRLLGVFSGQHRLRQPAREGRPSHPAEHPAQRAAPPCRGTSTSNAPVSTIAYRALCRCFQLVPLRPQAVLDLQRAGSACSAMVRQLPCTPGRNRSGGWKHPCPAHPVVGRQPQKLRLLFQVAALPPVA